MSFALSAAVTGMQAHQKMLDVAGNNLANLNTNGYKSSTINFAEMLSQTLKRASQPTTAIGGTNPQQMGLGVKVSAITRNMTQGNIVTTGQPLDIAIEGEGFLVLNDGEKSVFTRVGSFAVDADSMLVDPSTGYRVQRMGVVGEAGGFQIPGNSTIRIPYDALLPANSTKEVVMTGNLSADSGTPTTNVLSTGDIRYTAGGAAAAATTALADLDQFTGSVGANDQIVITGTDKDGTAISSTLAVTSTTTVGDLIDKINSLYSDSTASLSDGVIYLTDDAAGYSRTDINLSYSGDSTNTRVADNGWNSSGVAATGSSTIASLDELGGTIGSSDSITISGTTKAGATVSATLSVDSSTTLDDLLTAVNNAFPGSTATLVDGKIQLRDDTSGASQTDISLSYSGTGALSMPTDFALDTTGGSASALTMPGYFQLVAAGGNAVKNVDTTIYDALGGKHVMTAAFVKTDTANTWDLVVTTVSGDVKEIDDRRIEGITFNTDGGYSGLNSGTDFSFGITFTHDPTRIQDITAQLGTPGRYDGLTQFGGSSTAVITSQDGYESGKLASLGIDNAGVLIGTFTNGQKQDLATLALGLFRNPAGLESVGGGYYIPSENTGDPVIVQATSGGAGTIHGGSLEKSNVDVANEFVQMIEAQNGFQANARTISVANDILRELSTLIR
jgi:flagellar hook protein FlgE